MGLSKPITPEATLSRDLNGSKHGLYYFQKGRVVLGLFFVVGNHIAQQQKVPGCPFFRWSIRAGLWNVSCGLGCVVRELGRIRFLKGRPDADR